MKVDVLLPFHKIDDFFKAALKSLSNSLEVSIRLLLIDDRSTQDVFDLNSLDLNYEILQFKTTGMMGYGKALAIGSNYIESNYVALMNSDDLIDPTRFAKQIDILENGKDLCITNLQKFKNSKKLPAISGEMAARNYEPLHLLFGSYGANASWCTTREWWVKNMFFDESDYLDWRVGLNTFQSTNIGYLDEKLYFYRSHAGQFTKNRNHKETDIQPLYLEWANFVNSYGLNPVNRNIFYTMATPWLVNDEFNFGEVYEWVIRFKQFIRFLDPSIQESLNRLLSRRLLFALKNRNATTSNRIKLALQGRNEAMGVGLDLIKSNIF